MTGTDIRAVGPLTAAALPRDAVTGPLADLVEHANVAALEHARRRLSSWLPTAALVAPDRYFTTPAAHTWEGTDRPGIAQGDLFRLIAASPRHVSVSDKAEGLQVEVRTLGNPVEIADVGDPVEPGSSVAVLSPRRLQAVARGNASIELRQFDRQCRSWAPFADDLSAVTASDVHLKLFVADGMRSVNGWHRDRSDVLVTVIHGTKRFAVASAQAPDDLGDEHVEVDVVLRPGDALLLPRNRLHNATPAGELSALLSMGLMRAADWPFRQVPPSHLGFASYPRSPLAYQLCLRSHVPPTPPGAGVSSGLRTRVQGGLALVGSGGGAVRLVAAGTVYEADEAAVRVLAAVHGGEGLDVAAVAERAGLSKEDCATAVDRLMEAELVRSLDAEQSAT